ncbi:MAG: YidC/Oxa1 family membrane protein insertase [Actinomycetota bacterium]|nr:YidC/Oxa1 family membrane protein insertase [Actinomycetota bacterium]
MLVSANIFQPLIDVFESVLKFFHNNVGVGWGVSIVLLTVLVRAILVPLTLKQFRSMQSLQRLQPELKALQARYKDDKQRQQQELMKFYKENKVNPLGSCLPLVAQLPVFISLFYMLRSNLRKDICPHVQLAYQHAHGAAATTPCGAGHGAGFLFINDLTNKAAGATLVVLILLYVGTQLASSLMMSSATMDKTQRQIMLVMPLFFVIFIISFPAGVIVYWITTNSWTILQQYIVKRRIGPMGPPPGTDSGSNGTAVATNGAGGGLGGLIRGRLKPAEEPAAVGAGARGAVAPPPSPRKKKKRSGRRR